MADGGELVTRLRYTLEESALSRFINGLMGAGKKAESITHRIEVSSATAKRAFDKLVDGSQLNAFSAAVKRGETDLDRFYRKMQGAPVLKHDAGSFSRYAAMAGGLNPLDPHPADRATDNAHSNLGRINRVIRIPVEIPDTPIKRTVRNLQALSDRANVFGDRLSKRLGEAVDGLNHVEGGANKAGMSLARMQPLVAGLVGAFGALSFAHLADEAQGITDQIKGLTGNIDEASKAQEGLYQISRDSNTAYHSAVEVFSSLTTIRDKTKLSLQEELKLTQAINQASQIGGGSTAGRQRAITQLEQAFGMNKLDGGALNSIESQARGLTVTIARGMNVSVGDLKKLAGQGKITGEVLAKAFLSQADNVNKLAQNIRPTFSDMRQRAHDAAIHIYQRFDKAWKGVSAGIRFVIDMINKLERSVYSAASFMAQNFGGAEQAAKLLALAIGSIASSVLVLTVYRLASAFKALAFGVNASLWPFAAIAAAIAGLILIGEDLYTWVQGGDSLIGRAIGPYEQWRAKIEEVEAAFVGVWKAVQQLFAVREKPEVDVSGISRITGETTAAAASWKVMTEKLGEQGPAVPPLVKTFDAILTKVKETAEAVERLINALNDLQNGEYSKALNGFDGLPDDTTLGERMDFYFAGKQPQRLHADQQEKDRLAHDNPAEYRRRYPYSPMDAAPNPVERMNRRFEDLSKGSRLPYRLSAQQSLGNNTQNVNNTFNITTRDDPGAIAKAIEGRVSDNTQRTRRTPQMVGMPNAERQP